MCKKLSAVVILSVVFLFAMVFGASASAMDIVFWHHEAPAHRVAAFQQVIDLFEEENPGVRVEQEVVMWDDAWVRTLSAIEADTLPDFQFSIPDLMMTVYQAGAVEPITDLVEEIDEAYELFPAQRDMYLHDGEYWGLPVFTMVMLWTYRPSFLEEFLGTAEPPQTWEEALEYTQKITDLGEDDVFGIGLGGAKNLMTTEQAYIFLNTLGAKFFDEDGNVIFDNPLTIEAVDMYNEFFQYNPPGAEAWSWGEIELNIAAGVIAQSPYFAGVQKRFHEEFDTDDYAAAHIPLHDGRRGTITYPNEVHIYSGTFEDPERLEVVKDFIRFMMRPEINYILTAVQEPGGFYPTTVAASQAEEYWNDPIVERFENIHHVAFEALADYANLYGFEYGKWVNLGIGDITGADVLADVIHRVVTGEMTTEEAVAWGHAEMEEYSVPVPR